MTTNYLNCFSDIMMFCDLMPQESNYTSLVPDNYVRHEYVSRLFKSHSSYRVQSIYSPDVDIPHLYESMHIDQLKTVEPEKKSEPDTNKPALPPRRHSTKKPNLFHKELSNTISERNSQKKTISGRQPYKTLPLPCKRSLKSVPSGSESTPKPPLPLPRKVLPVDNLAPVSNVKEAAPSVEDEDNLYAIVGGPVPVVSDHLIKTNHMHKEGQYEEIKISAMASDIHRKRSKSDDNLRTAQTDGSEAICAGDNVSGCTTTHKSMLKVLSHSSAPASPNPSATISFFSGSQWSIYNDGGCFPGRYANLNEVPEDISELTVEDLSQCLCMLNMAEHVQAFADKLVDGDLLKDLNAEDIKEEFGITGLNAKKLAKFVKGWRPKMKPRE